MARKTALIVFALSSAFGHHSFQAEYDTAKPVRLEGVISEFDFVNPHAAIYLDAYGTQWWIETASPAALSRRGVTKISLREGMRVVVEGFQARDGSHKVKGIAVILPGGAKLLLDPSARGIE